jgi:hypothetical protein
MVAKKDPNKILIDLSESPQTDFGRVDFLEQSHDQKVFSAIWELESQVNNGGFSQYFENHSGETAEFAPIALRSIGADRCAAIVERALRTVTPDAMPTDYDQRQRVLEVLDDARRNVLDDLDEAFYTYPDDLTELLYAFVRARPEVFGPVEAP